MNYFDDEANVEAYIRMAEGYDGRAFVEVLKDLLPKGAKVLELGMGPGVDLLLLEEAGFQVSGSDRSKVFLERFRAAHPEADLLQLDAVTLETGRKFDCIYSNKVLIHLSQGELRESFHRQADLLNPGGLLLHTFWYGEGEEEHDGLRTTYHTRETLTEALRDAFDIQAFARYAEIEPGDSFYIILKRNK
jgi:trans-aconitate methyltransferase